MSSDDRRSGLAAGVCAYLVWGTLPIYLKALAHVRPEDVLAWRVLWSLVLCLIIAFILGQLRGVLPVVRNRRRMALLAISGLMIGINWLIYIWAVGHNHVLDASLGYFINPLINVVFGVSLLGERLDRMGWMAVALAAAGVAVLTVAQGSLPWIALSLAITFAIYGLIRKQVAVNPVTGLLVETLVLMPVAILWFVLSGDTGLGIDLTTDLLLITAGPLTAIPLLLFAFAARRLPLSALGLLQYLTPSMIFLLGYFVFQEPLGLSQLAAFGLIWSGLVIYAAKGIRQSRRRALAQAATLR